MSHALYETRLYLAGGKGVAKLHGHGVRLYAPPRLPGVDLEVDAIDYAPETHTAMVLPRHGGWRDMTSEEMRAADELLAELTKGAPCL